jgi:sigma-B regulation protein RsbU (phosphoserine phosphatase)
MVIAKTLLKNAAMQGYGPDEVFMRVNNQLCEGNEAGLFVTCWIGLLTLSTGELRFANAGHTPPVICRGETVEFLKSKPNLMLAEIEGIPYSEYTTVLNRGDRLFVYTDGVTEATNASDRLYGEERLLNACKRLRNVSSKELLKSIRDDIDAFVAGAPQFDDITMLELSLKA